MECGVFEYFWNALQSVSKLALNWTSTEVAVIDWLAIGYGVSKELFTQLLLDVMDRRALRKFVSW